MKKNSISKEQMVAYMQQVVDASEEKQGGAVSRFGSWLVGGNTDKEQKEEDKKEKAIEKNLEARRARREAAERWEEEKEADFSTDVQAALDAKRTSALRADAIRDITHKALAMLGVGAAARGGVGLYNVAFPDARRQKGQKPAVLDVPYYPSDEEEDEESLKESADLLAATPRLSVASERVISQHVKSGDTLKEAIKKAYPFWHEDVIEEHASYREKCANWFWDTVVKGEGAKNQGDIPWHGAGAMLGMVGGGYAGWKIIDKILDSRRKAEQQSRLDKAKAEFEQALTGQFSTEDKEASDLSGQLDALYDKLEKTALLGVDQNTWGKMIGAYGMYAAPAAVLSGLVMYRSSAKRRRKEVLEKAIKKRKQRRQALSPPEIYARPVPLPIDKEEEEREEAGT